MGTAPRVSRPRRPAAPVRAGWTVRLKKSLGQHLLVDPSYQRRIVEALCPGAEDEVLEIGPGVGALTQHLVGRVSRLVLVELDPEFAAELQRRFGGHGVEVLIGDALRLDLAGAVERWGAAKVVGNIPYRITSPLLGRLLGRSPRPREIVLTVQKEVADRLASPPGRKAYGALTVGVRAVADVGLLFRVPKGAFRPVPKVDSATLRIVPHDPPRLTPGEERDLRTLTRSAFGRRRKQLQTILRDAPAYRLDRSEAQAVLAELGIAPAARPETLAPETFVTLAGALRRRDRPRAPGRTESPS